MKTLFRIVPLLLLVACGRDGGEKKRQEHVSAEIHNLLLAVQSSSTCSPGQLSLVKFIDENCRRLLLLSRDTENTPTILYEANDFFFNSFSLKELDTSGLQKLTEEMPPQRRSLAILENELWLLNASAMNCPGFTSPMPAVKDQEN